MGTYTDPTVGPDKPRVWSNAFYNFDNLGNALLTLFITVTMNGWSRECCCCLVHVLLYLEQLSACQQAP